VESFSGAGLIEVDDALTHVGAYLRDPDRGLGLDPGPARRQAKTMVAAVEAQLGLLVRHSPTQIGFLHRTFLEYLASIALARLPLEEQAAAVERHCADPLWREVILGLFFSNKRPEEVKELVDRLQTRKRQAIGLERLSLESLLAETAFGDFNCSPRLSHQLAAEAFRAIETGDRMSHRVKLLGYALGGLSSTKVRGLVKDKVRTWFPCRDRPNPHIYEAMARWPADSAVIDCLWRAMHDEEPSSQQAAARTLARIGGGDADLGQRVSNLARAAEDPHTRAAALEALVRGWPSLNPVLGILEAALQSGSTEVCLAAIQGKIILGTHTNNDKALLLQLVSTNSDASRSQKGDIPRLLIEGWPTDRDVKSICLRILESGSHRGSPLAVASSWSAVLNGFPQDADVTDLLVTTLKRSDPGSMLPLDLAGNWNLIARGFRDNPVLVNFLDEWIPQQQEGERLASLALVGRTPTAKAKLLQMIEAGVTTHAAVAIAAALLDGWGMQDQDVASRFQTLAAEPIQATYHIAHLYPRIITDKAECKRRLMSMLRDPEFLRQDLVLAALRELDNASTNTDVLDIVLQSSPGRTSFLATNSDQLLRQVIEGYHQDNRVREIAKQQLLVGSPPYEVIAESFPNDSELRGLMIERLAPLPDQLRMLIATRLPHESQDANFSLELLGDYDREESVDVKCQTSLSYWTAVKANRPINDCQLARLASEIVSADFTRGGQREAAFCGLVTIGKLDIMMSADNRDPLAPATSRSKKLLPGEVNDNTPPNKPICAIGVGGMMMRRMVPIAPLARCILDKWQSITDMFGHETCRRLSNGGDDWLKLWEQLCPFADNYGIPRRAATSFLESCDEATRSTNILLFLGRTTPRSWLLLEHCRRALLLGDPTHDVSGSIGFSLHEWRGRRTRAVIGLGPFVAAELLGTHFRDDPDILALLLAEAAGRRLNKIILCLCEGWPKNGLLDESYDAVMSNQLELPTLVWHRLLGRRGSSSQVYELLLSLIAQGTEGLGRAGSYQVGPFVRRLREDDSLAAMFQQRLGETASPSEKATVPRLLQFARGLTEELRSWCQDELARQVGQGNSPEFGFDLTAGVVRAVSQCLLDVFDAETTFVDDFYTL
jgi:hypothetical protein